jgi:hypothetical protein
MKIKTNELIDDALDWAVALAENWAGADFEAKPYSTDWSQGGPIIEREGICLHRYKGTAEWSGTYSAQDPEYFGSTPLIAAMRCYVSSKLGDEVDVPEELCQPTA